MRKGTNLLRSDAPIKALCLAEVVVLKIRDFNIPVRPEPAVVPLFIATTFHLRSR